MKTSLGRKDVGVCYTRGARSRVVEKEGALGGGGGGGIAAAAWMAPKR